MRLNKIGSQLDRKSKNCFFFTFLNVFFQNQKEQNSDLTAFLSKIQVFYRSGWTKGGTHENEF